MDNNRDKTLAELAAEANGSHGLVCPVCRGTAFRVYYTRPQSNKILRRRICMVCGHLLTTVERPR